MQITLKKQAFSGIPNRIEDTDCQYWVKITSREADIKIRLIAGKNLSIKEWIRDGSVISYETMLKLKELNKENFVIVYSDCNSKLHMHEAKSGMIKLEMGVLEL